MTSSPLLSVCLLSGVLALGACATTRSAPKQAHGPGELMVPVVERVGEGGDFAVSLAGEPGFSTAGYGNAAECEAGWAAFLTGARGQADLGSIEGNDWNPCTASELPGEPTAADEEEPHLIAGGYMDQDPTIVELAPAAAAALEQLRVAAGDPSLQLVAIRAAQTQVVAGTNYRFTLDVQGAAGPQAFDVVVYEPLGGEPFELSRWAPIEAAPASEGILKSLQAGDVACYLELEAASGPVTHYGEFDVCDAADLIGQAVVLEFVSGSVIAPSCQGDPECPDRIEVQLVSAISPK